MEEEAVILLDLAAAKDSVDDSAAAAYLVDSLVDCCVDNLLEAP